MGPVEDRTLADIDRLAAHLVDIVADLALEADVGDEPLACLRVEARHVAGIGVAVGVAVLDVEQDDEIVAAVDGGHAAAPSRWCRQTGLSVAPRRAARCCQ